MIEIGNLVQIRPEHLFIFLFGLVLLTIIFTFVLPPILGSQKLKFGFSYKFKLIKKHAVLSATLTGIILVALVGSYLWYLSTRPQVISSDNFRRVESATLKSIEDSKLYAVITDGELLLFDVRSEEEFFKSHINNSFSVPIEEIENSRALIFLGDRKVAFYSSENDFDSAKKAAFYVFNNFETRKIYIIKDGYENLSSSGFTLYAGDAFEPELIKDENK